MACIARYNLYISVGDPCKPRWTLHVQDLAFIKKNTINNENTAESNFNRIKISDWLLIDH